MAVVLGFGALGTILLLVVLRAGALKRRRAVARRLSMLQELEGGWEVSGAWTGASEAVLAALRMLGSAQGPGVIGVGVILASCVAGVTYAGWISQRSGGLWGLVGGTALAALAWMVGGSVLEGASRRRRERISRALSDWVDTVACYVQAGMPFESAVGLAIRARIRSGKELKEEWFRYLQETRLGNSRNEALVALARRCDSAEMHQVIGAVMASPDDREGLAQSMHACALDLQASALQAKRIRRFWGMTVVGLTGIGMGVVSLIL